MIGRLSFFFNPPEIRPLAECGNQPVASTISLIDAPLGEFLGNLPRLVTSRSIEKLRDDSRIVKKIDEKISVVERAIYSIGRDTEVSSNGDRLMLEKFLNADE